MRTHDFAVFQGKFIRRPRCVPSTGRNGPGRDKLYFDIVGNGFLYNMVRIIVGTLLQVGRGKRPPEDMVRLMAPARRDEAGPTAPAKGLCLMRVYY